MFLLLLLKKKFLCGLQDIMSSEASPDMVECRCCKEYPNIVSVDGTAVVTNKATIEGCEGSVFLPEA